MDKYFKLIKQQLWIVLVLVAAVGVFAFKYINAKLNAAKEPPLPELPNNGKTIPDSYDNTAKAIAQQLKDVTTGLFTWASEKEKVFVILYNLTDDQLVYVYRTYSNLFWKDTAETMTGAIESEINVSISSVRALLLNKLKNLNCL